MAAGRPCFLSGILITASSNNSFILPSQPPWEVYITNYQRTGERTKPDNSCDLLVVSHDQNAIPFKSNPVFPIDSQFGVNPLTSRRLCSGTIAFTASIFKVGRVLGTTAGLRAKQSFPSDEGEGEYGQGAARW